MDGLVPDGISVVSSPAGLGDELVVEIVDGPGPAGDGIPRGFLSMNGKVVNVGGVDRRSLKSGFDLLTRFAELARREAQ
jgi:hypothetical protein